MKLHGWGRYPVIEAAGPLFETTAEAARLLSAPGHWIAHGMGKSYGDSALNRQVLMTRRFNKLLDFDAQKGVVTCESGISLAELIQVFLPEGWFPGVVPGTKLITVGGAIASDVHGKNHHAAGCFSATVISMRLMLPDGSIVACSPGENSELFRAACGGMGLTGLILDAAIQLQPVHSAHVRETVIRCRNLEEAFEQFEKYRHITYSVAWIDCLARGACLGRSVLMIGEHADDGRLVPTLPRPAAVPFECPGFLLNRYSVSLFNHLYFHIHPTRLQNQLKPMDAFFFPLDRIAGWNRMYGSRGFTQYQLVLPKTASFDGLKSILDRVARSGIGSFLAVLKLFGPENGNYLSFPMEGYTLTLDFKIQPRLFPLLDELDRMVVDHGGRLYLTKDVRMQPETFRKGYPRADDFAAVRATHRLSDKLNSLQSLRLGI
ncbi:MAG: FAD-binding oxidoreductase [Desulfobacteraceae bacterium]|jgi:FAD/FMN-containing dehydrogenase